MTKQNLKYTFFFLIIIFFGILGIAKKSYAETYYVRKDGNDSSLGTVNTPVDAWLSIQKAAETMVAGDKVYIQAGIYDERVTTRFSGLDSNNMINYIAQDDVYVNQFIINHSWNKVDGFNFNSSDVSSYPNYIVFNSDASHSIVTNINAVASPMDNIGAIRFQASSSYCEFSNSEFSGGSGGTAAITIRGEKHQIKNNVVHDLSGDFVRTVNAFHITISGNEVYNVADPNDRHADFFQVFGDTEEDAYDFLIERNYVHDCSDMALVMMSTDDMDIRDFTFRNNIFKNISHHGQVSVKNTKWLNNLFWRVSYYSGASAIRYGNGECLEGAEIKNNIFIGCGDGGGLITGNRGYGNSSIDVGADYNYFAELPNDEWGEVDYESDGEELHWINGGNPFFVDEVNYDFRLQGNSPALNYGVDILDLDNDGSTSDLISLGAYVTGNEIIGLMDYATPDDEYCGDSICSSSESCSYCALDCGVCPVDTIRADVNQDQNINSDDTFLVLRNALGMSMSGTNWQVSATSGDVNCDGLVTMSDALLIFRYSLGLSMDGTDWCEN